MYKSKDISIVIPTFNRAPELEINLEHLSKLKSKPFEVLLVDQSTDNNTKKAYLKYKKKLKILKYLRSEKPSIAIAKNVGLRNSSKKTKIILFLDDDAYVGENYIDEIIGAYNRHPEASGIYGEEEIYKSENIKKIHPSIASYLRFRLDSLAKKIFLLGYRGDKGWRITSPFGNTFNYEIKGDVEAHWFAGTNPSFKKEALKEMSFDENFFGWSLGEDIDISYRIYKKHGNLYVVPSSLTHSNPPREDTPERKIKRIYMNQINHFYLFYKDMPEMKFRFTWNYIGIFILRFFALFNIFRFKKNYIEFKYLLKSFVYCLKNTDKIQKGDLSLPLK